MKTAIIPLLILATSVCPALAQDEFDGLIPTAQFIEGHKVELQLSPTQISQIQRIVTQAQKKHTALETRLKQFQQRVPMMLSARTFDAKRTLDLARSMLDTDRDMRLVRAEAKISIYALMSPGQRETMLKIVEEEKNAKDVLIQQVASIREVARQLAGSGRSIDFIRDRLKGIEQLALQWRFVQASDEANKILGEIAPQGVNAISRSTP